jgi:uncharacterized membrane protein YqhA
MGYFITTAAIVKAFLQDRWHRLRATGDAGEIDEKVIIIALMSAATITIIATVIIVALNARADEAAGFLE